MSGPTQTVTLSLYRFESLAARAWAFAMMGLARPAMARVRDLSFWKLCGSGTEEGFTPKPNFGVYAILCVWPDRAVAEARLNETWVFRRYRRRAVCHGGYQQIRTVTPTPGFKAPGTIKSRARLRAQHRPDSGAVTT